MPIYNFMHVASWSQAYLFIWKDFLYVVHIFQARQWSATSVVHDCPPGHSLPNLTTSSLFKMVVCLYWDAFACMQLKTTDQVHQACAHFTASAGELSPNKPNVRNNSENKALRD